ncbi:helix-turn-helix domain-containing protein [Falsihalocynthiibacter arcticus]|uniref:helix-turn-helix domain-containing protein n=1 Tax=Falsihalocynthiibacter arcticus TaxID=1579316 RepID=UPI001F23A94D|nr:helix-turn-helix domain-containing protein [Falsihalocynthiibacter arcticus]
MIRPNFLTTADRLELLSCVKRQREDYGVARRANALSLLNDGMSCAQIAKVLFLDDDTVRSWHKQYLAEDWEAVAYDGWKGGQSRMTIAHEADLSEWLEERFCRSTAQIRAYMGAKFNIHYLILAASSFWPAWGSSIANQRRCPVWLTLKSRPHSSHFIRTY